MSLSLMLMTVRASAIFEAVQCCQHELYVELFEKVASWLSNTTIRTTPTTRRNTKSQLEGTWEVKEFVHVYSAKLLFSLSAQTLTN